MSEQSDQSPIIVGVGLTEESRHVLEKLCGLANGPERIIAVHAIDPSMTYFQFDPAATDTVVGALQNLRSDAEEQLQALCRDVGVTQFAVVEGKPADELHKMAATEAAGLIAVGSHGYRGWRALLGETASSVLHGTECSVLAVLTKEHEAPPKLSYDRILLAVDMTEETDQVIEAALTVRERFGSELSLMTAVKPIGQNYPGLDLNIMSATEAGFEQEAAAQYQSMLDELCSRYDITGGYTIGHGPAAEEIHRVAAKQEADLVVVGSHGRHGLRLILGSTPNALLHGMTCDVYAVRL